MGLEMLHRVPGALQCIRGALAVAMLAVCLCATAWDRSGAQTSQPTHTPSEESPEDFPPGPGREEAFYACVACHNFKLVAAQGMSRERWDETITFMIARHNMPAIEGEDRRLILDYLATTFPERPPARRGWQNPFQQ
jgi:hypothetical protein